MFANVPLSLISNTTQRILSQSNNIAYGTRGVVRVAEVPSDRKADYFLRDFYMVLATAYLGELGFRGVDLLYNIPLMTRTLRLNRLSELYPGALNYTRMPDVVRERMMGTLVKSDSNYAVPKVLEELRASSSKHLTEAEQKQLGILLDHLHKNLNFSEYVSEKLVQRQHITPDEAKLVNNAVKAMAGHVDETMKQHGPLRELSAEFQEKLANLLKERGDDEALKALHAHPLKEKLLGLVKEGMESHTTLSLLKRVQKSGTWPKMASSVILNFIFYGCLANYLDSKALQPWQKKLVAQRGSSEEIVKPGYLGLIPGLAVLVAGLSDKIAPKFIQKLGYFNRFAVVGGAALLTYTTSMVAMVKHALSKPPKNKPGNPTAQPPQAKSPTVPVKPAPVATSYTSGSMQEQDDEDDDFRPQQPAPIPQPLLPPPLNSQPFAPPATILPAPSQPMPQPVSHPMPPAMSMWPPLPIPPAPQSFARTTQPSFYTG